MVGEQDFFVAGADDPVGVLRGAAPTVPGRYEFDPYRGQGHAVFARVLRAGRVAQCWFLRQGRRVSFSVTREELVLGAPGEGSAWYLEVSQVGEAPDAGPGAPAGGGGRVSFWDFIARRGPRRR